MAGSSFFTYQATKAALASGREVGRLYVLWGDGYLCGRLISSLRARLFPAGSIEDLDLLRLDGTAHGPAEMLVAARTAPFLAPRRMVIVERVRAFRARGRTGDAAAGADLAENATDDPVGSGGSSGSGGSGGGDEAAGWERLLTGIPASACVVLRPDAPPDARLRLTKLAAEKGVLADCSTTGRDGASLAGQVLREAAAGMGCKLDWRVQSLLVATVGTDCGQLVGELEKLRLYRGNEPITEADVLLLCPRTAEADIWQMLDAVVTSRAGEAARLVRAALERGENPVALIASLASQIRMMARASERTAAGVSPGTLATVLGANRYWVDQSLRRSRAFSLAALYWSLRELARLDLAIKTGAVDGEIGVESFVLALCAVRGAETQKARGANPPRGSSGSGFE
ncbi:MAG: DNA polymerase III subunit delta [Bacillota bacterium]|nr:DNA polymerase III subunit delta [Bacillota bacterium]